MNFWKGVFSDDGQPSFSRISTGLALCFACGWVSAIVVHNHQIPDAMTMAGLTAFVGALYGVNRFSQPKATPDPSKVQQ